MVRFLFFLISIIVAWYIIDLLLRGMRFVIGGRRPYRQPPADADTRPQQPNPRVDYRDVQDAEFKDITDEPKDTP